MKHASRPECECYDGAMGKSMQGTTGRGLIPSAVKSRRNRRGNRQAAVDVTSALPGGRTKPSSASCAAKPYRQGPAN
jgi:hypothetical protein